MKKILAVLSILTVFAQFNQAAAASNNKGKEKESSEVPAITQKTYFKEREKGWFWYLEEKKTEEKKEKEKEKAGPQPGKPEEKALTEMTTDELKGYSEQAIKEALNDPSDLAKVRKYMIVQKFILDKSQAFTDTWEKVLFLYPELDWTREHPVSAAGLDVEKVKEESEISEVMRQIAGQGGLFFFFESNCPYCREQSRILKTLEYSYGITIFPVSLDGLRLPEFEQYKKNNGIAERIGVTRVPAIVLAVPPKTMVPVSSGIVTLGEIKKRIYDVVTNPDLLQRADSSNWDLL